MGGGGGYLFQALGIRKGRDLVGWGIWKGGKSVISVCKRIPKGLTYLFYGSEKSKKRSGFLAYSYFKDNAFTAALRDTKF